MKKKYIVIALLLVLIILVFGLVYIFIFKDSPKKDIKQIQSKMEEFLDLSYQYYLISEGPLEVGEGTIKLNDKTYYYVTNENFSNTEDIVALVNKLIYDKYSLLYIDKVYSNREFINTSKGLYVYFKNEPCKVSYNLENEDYNIYMQVEDEYSINYDSVGVTAIHDDNSWFLSSPLYFCEVPDGAEIEE